MAVKDVENAIIEYMEQAKNTPSYPCCWCCYHEGRSGEVQRLIDSRTFLEKRPRPIDLSIYENEFGIKLPDEVKTLINTYRYPCIYGFTEQERFSSEAVFLPHVCRYKEGDDEGFLSQDLGLSDLARDWLDSEGDIKRYLPIGSSSYFMWLILYDMETGKIYRQDEDEGNKPTKEPLADSLAEFIRGLYIEGRK